ncbi:SMP-30/gluconolactonase/LRE family protein [Paracoccus sp. (in: a-proteobacteria)]|uniref:SMP-30/gluconolactonase/LRE family protein n=1 Tax=Paracoccus sp. TaxID=267 RepID=UPI0028A10DEE|nr:SMP-30/gluconolactonase/LRE family protein [Paracoccus sp. (in: a-proteobacteria)]
MLDFALLADLKGDLLESPVWDDRRESLFLCDIDAGLIHEIALTGERRNRWDMGDKVTALGLCASGKLIAALSRSVVIFDPQTGHRQMLWDGFDEPSTSRLNDGKVGPDGAFWVGSMDGRPQRQPISRLYRITAQGAQVMINAGIEISNGLAWSADGKQMFFSDSRGPWIDRFDFAPASAALTNRIRIRDLDEATGRPDGAACDQEGYYWSAGVSAGVLNRFRANGEIERRVPTPIPAPTMPCFCGKDLRQLAITSHSQGNDHPQSGSVFLANAPVAGVPVSRMKGL